MIKEYISLEYVISLLDEHIKNSRGAEHYAYQCIKSEIECAPDTKAVHFKDVTDDAICKANF